MTDRMLKKIKQLSKSIIHIETLNLLTMETIKNYLNLEEAKKLMLKHNLNMPNSALALKNFE